MKLHHTVWLVFLVGGIGLSVLAGPALAGPRDDVLNGISRCGGIPDDRSWLDCVYGAAQPMRGALGLPPAPASQTRLVPPAIGTYGPQSLPVYGAPAPQYGASLPAVAAAPAGPPPMPHRSTGLLNIFGGSRPTVSNLRMASYSVGRDGKFSITLSDGEIWDQDAGDPGKPNWKGTASQYIVNVYEGALRTYNMEVSNDPVRYKVHRVK